MDIQGLGAAGFTPASHEPDPLEGPAPDHVSTVLWNLSSRDERADLLAKGPPLFGAGSLAAHEAAPVQPNSSEALARKLVHAGGFGDQSDVDLVVAQVQKLPPDALTILDRAHTKIIACRDSVTDFAPSLRGVHPRNWPKGYSFDSVPGVYRREINTVIVAVRGHGTAAGAHVPSLGDGQGSTSVAMHETMHAVDAHARGGPLSSTPAFLAARSTDLSALAPYEIKPAPAGPEETFAESAARFYSGNHSSASNPTPALDAYWRADPLAHR